MPLSFPLRGIITPTITPLTADFSLDQPSLRKLLEHIIAGGVHGIFALGTSGEGPMLSLKTQCEVIAESCRIAAGRVPVLAGVTHSSIEESLDLARHAAHCGADAVVHAGPLYMPVGQQQLIRFIERFADASPLPVFLYNMPSHTHVVFEETTVARLAAHRNVAGLKDSSSQILYLHGLIRAVRDRPDFSLLVGPEEMTAECILLGIHGGVNGGSNLFPKLYVELYEAASAGNLERVRTLQERVILISRKIYSAGTYGSSYLQGVKCAASLLGLCRNILAPPYAPLEGDDFELIRSHLAELKAL